MKFSIDYVWFGGDEYYKEYCVGSYSLFRTKISKEEYKERA